MLNIVYIILFAYIFIKLTKRSDNFTARVYDDNQVLNKLQKIKEMYSDLRQLLLDIQIDLNKTIGDDQLDMSIYTDQNSQKLSDDDIDRLIFKQIPQVLSKWQNISIVENKEQTYVQNKGCKLELSLVDQNGKMYETNIVRYVLIHEMSHMINPVYGHGYLFWKINKRLLFRAVLCGKYEYQDYRQNPFKYGKVDIRYNIIEDLCQNGKCYKRQQ